MAYDRVHFADPHHPLENTQYSHSQIGHCSICLLKLAGFSGYGCYSCNIHLHSACAGYFQETIVSFFAHPSHTLKLSRSPGRICNICRGDCPHGSFVYRCIGCGFDVHPLCSMLPETVASPLDPRHGAVSQRSLFGTTPAAPGQMMSSYYGGPVTPAGYNYNDPACFQGYSHAGPAVSHYYCVPPTYYYGPAIPSGGGGNGASGSGQHQQSIFNDPSNLMGAIARFLVCSLINAVASDMLAQLLSGLN